MEEQVACGPSRGNRNARWRNVQAKALIGYCHSYSCDNTNRCWTKPARRQERARQEFRMERRRV